MSGNSEKTPRTGRLAGLLNSFGASLSTAVQFALVSAISFSLALFVAAVVPESGDTAMIGAMWAMISAIIVTQDTRSATLSTAWIRILGSLIGAVLSAIYLLLFPFSIVGMGILIGVVVIICELLRLPGYLRLASLTAGVIIVISVVNPDIPPVVNAATRFFEVIIGSTVAIAAAWIWHYLFHSP